MKLRFLGHAAFALELGGVKLCLDPHKPGALGGRFQLPPIHGPFDAIAMTHPHEDHSAWTPELGTTQRIDGETRVGRVQVRARSVFHDQEHGLKMGLSTMLSFESEGLRVVHCGDIGAWNAEDVHWLQGTDVLLVPVGGTYTLDGQLAAEFVQQVRAKIAIPMHAHDPRVDLPLAPIADFLQALNLPHVQLEILDSEQQPWPPAPIVVLDPP